MTAFPHKKYQIIYADPPWQFTGLGSKGIRSGKMREDKPNLHRTIRLEEKYPTMTVDELKLLPCWFWKDCRCGNVHCWERVKPLILQLRGSVNE